jgi:uncharacterized membrane protein YjjP (DUF1212 family)
VSEAHHPSARRLTPRRLSRGIGHIFASKPLPEGIDIEPPPPADVLEMLRRLGSAMVDGGDAVSYIAEHLDRIADAYGVTHVSFFVLPTGVFVRVDQGAQALADFAPARGEGLRLDQIGALYDVVREAEQHALEPADVIVRLDDVLQLKPRFGPFVQLFGFIVLTLGLGLLLNPTLQAMPAYVVLALVVALVQLLARRVPTLDIILPVATAFVVTYASYKLAGPVFHTQPDTLLIPPLVTFLPGAALTMGTVELATGSMISGASRLMYGLTRLLLLAAGIAIGTAAVGHYTLSQSDTFRLGSWAGWIGVAVFGVGHFIFGPAPRRSLLWLWLTLYVAYAAQVLGGNLWGASVSGFAGAILLPPLAHWIERRRTGPPTMVSFLPAFWMLVPGALGLQGVTEIFTSDGTAGISDFTNTIISVLAIALGVLVGSSLRGRQPTSGSRAA